MLAAKDELFTRPSGGYTIARSVRLRSSASAYFNRTMISGNRKTYTISFWVKRGKLATQQFMFTGFDGSISANIQFNSSDQLAFNVDGGNGYQITTTQVFRDPSAWYHLVFAVDTTQATSTNRLKMYVNGVQVTALASSSYPPQNNDTYFFGAFAHWIGASQIPSLYTDGYLTEFNAIDGQALTPSSFGSTNALTGVWQPAKYTGTYGTNGFYLNFSSNGTSAALGTDFSGNSNTWTVNNISVTAGTTYDSMTDVPTLTSATAANYAVWNPNYKDITASTTSTSNANLTTNGQFAFSSIGVTTDKFYFELTIGSANNQFVGVCASPYSTANLRAYNKDGTYYTGSGWISYGATYTTSDVIGVALDMTNQTIEFFKNNTSQGQKTSIGLSSQTIFPMIYVESSGGITVNFGQQPFIYTPPSGFVRLNTYNLPTSTITNGAAYMAATLYTGTGASLTVANTVGSTSFQPDWVWAKSRSATTDHALYDSVRGVQKQLESNNTDAETTETTGLTAFGSTGFTVGALAQMNTSAATYVAWQWKAGTTSASNTNGTITSTVSVGATQGFSVVTYTGNGTQPSTIGHGLGVAPSMVIVKTRNSALYDWNSYHISLGNTQYIALNTTAAASSAVSLWNNTSPTSTVFTINHVAVNTSSNTYVAYCFAAVAGYSAFGSYTGNSSTDGPFVYLGFRPRWILLKKTSAAGNNWFIWDTSRDTYNVVQNYLWSNSSSAEGADVAIDVLSNGFKVRAVSGNYNDSGGTYIYGAFAENPFKNSLAR